MILELYKFRNLIRELVLRDIKKKYRRSVLGILWSMLNPLFMMMITAMVFSHLFRFEIKNFVLYLLTGQIIFTFFSESTGFAMGSIIDNSGLLKKVYVPKYLFPLSRVLSSGVNLLFTLPAMFFVMVFTNADISINLVWAVIPLFLLCVFNLGIGLILSSCAVFFRDLFHLYGVLLTGLNYATPIFYPVSIIPEKYVFLVNLNPLTYFLNMFREIVYLNHLPSIRLIFYCVLISFVTLTVGLWVYKKTQNKFVMYI